VIINRLWEVSTPTDLTPFEVALLRRVYTGAFGDGPGLVYGEGETARPSHHSGDLSQPGASVDTAATLRALTGLGAIEWLDHRSQRGWSTGMWGARLTVVGANAVFCAERKTATDSQAGLDGHPGCRGHWRRDGTCTGCRALRPLDRTAYLSYLDALSDVDRATALGQADGPQLFCVEHGYLGRAQISTDKTCRLPGTHLHDGGLFRVSLPACKQHERAAVEREKTQ
jgi:hypothetical protein